MMDYTHVLGIVAATVLVLILIVIAALYVATAKRFSHYLSGLWVGDPGFLDRAGLSDFQLFLAPEEDGLRQGYLLIADTEGGLITNQAIELRVESGPGAYETLKAATSSLDVRTSPEVHIAYDDAKGPKPIPEALKMSLSVMAGTLALFDDDKVYAFLEKDLASSVAALDAYGA
jgi:hypothetical protein